MNKSNSNRGLDYYRLIISNGTVLALLILLFFHSAMVVLAQGSVKSNHGAWAIVCDKPPSATSEQCVLLQNVVAEDESGVGLSVAVLKTTGSGSGVLRVLAPLGILLPVGHEALGLKSSGLGLKIDGKNIGPLIFVRCFKDGCYSETRLKGRLLRALKAGNTAVFTVYQSTDKPVDVSVDLSGFTAGYKQLP